MRCRSRRSHRTLTSILAIVAYKVHGSPTLPPSFDCLPELRWNSAVYLPYSLPAAPSHFSLEGLCAWQSAAAEDIVGLEVLMTLCATRSVVTGVNNQRPSATVIFPYSRHHSSVATPATITAISLQRRRWKSSRFPINNGLTGLALPSRHFSSPLFGNAESWLRTRCS